MTRLVFFTARCDHFAMGAKAAIWIASEPRPEHVAAVAWLNEFGSTTFLTWSKSSQLVERLLKEAR